MRLAKAAKEFNVGTSSIVEFLASKGIDVANSPASKLDSDAVTLLKQEYQASVALKESADQIDIGSARRQASEKDVEVEVPKPVIEAPKPPVEEPKVIEVKEEEEQPEKVATVETPKPIVEVEKPEPKVIVATKPEEKKPKEEVIEKIVTEAPKLKGAKVVDKIDLDKIGSKKKKAPKKEQKPPVKAKKIVEEKVETKPPVVAKDKDVLSPNKKEETIIPKDPPAKKTAAVKEEPKKIETQFKSLTGPKVLGKIELPTPTDKKRKRKRIVKKVDGSPVKSQGQKTQPGQRGRNNNNNGRKDNRRNNRSGGNRRDRAKDDQETVSDQEIQDKIKATMARMQGKKSGNKGDRSKYKRQKRKEHAEAREEELMEEQLDNTLVVSEFIALNELAALMDVAPTDLITACFSIGMMVTINQRLDAEVIQLLGEENGFTIEFASVEQIDEEEEEEDDPADLKPRSPIVTVMGHVDHGKTSLLDHIRKANVIAGEAGGITQHIGAYEVQISDGSKITFLDTPGHEAFTAMRARGARVTDIAIIVIAADDSVMPQTKEAISHAQAAGVPMIFAFNKMDKPGANADKVREELSQMNILVEEWGGDFQTQEISAKHGTNIDELLEKVQLQAELLELSANPNKDALGTIVEAKLDKGRGYVSSILVQAGTLEIGDFIVAGQHFGKVKAMFDERGNPKSKAGPSTPVEILGISGAPTSGESFKVYKEESVGKGIATKREQIMREQGLKARKHITLDEIGRRLALGSFQELNIIIKGDVGGSVEAIADSLQKLSTEEIAVTIIHKGVGPISESDILLASASDAVVIAFQVRPSQQARQLADKEDIEIRTYSVIYDAIEDVKSAMEGMLKPKVEERIICNIEIQQTFKISKVGTIAGCQVLDGKAKRDMKIRLIRDGIVVYSGELESLRRFKDDVKEVFAGQECGLNIKNYNDIKSGDIIEGYEEFEIKRKLES